MAAPQINHIAALDVGARRIGVATANSIAKIASPLTFVENDGDTFTKLKALLKREDIGVIVVGLPRNLNGEDTDQTRFVREFVGELSKHVEAPIYLQDEALTSVKAEKALMAKGKKFGKGDVDALAAAYILEDYLIGE